MTEQPWEIRAAAKRLECQSKIPKEWKIPQAVWDSLPLPLEKNKVNLIDLKVVKRCGILSDKELDITENHDAASLLKLLAEGKLKSSEVTAAFSKRAAIAGQLTNCLTEVLFDSAKERARYLDSEREKGRIVGPLHGLPVSLKDTFHVIGSQATIGFTAYIDLQTTKNAALVDLLLDLGAVPYVKTNVPQTMMTGDSENIIFGRTLNPWNTMLTAGGSSGGEGALVALRGSPLGIGSDIAGSIRIPSLCCGLYGFRPTAGRIPFGGQQGFGETGIHTILPVAGPLANDIDSISLLMKAVIDQRPATYDSTAIDVPWRDNIGQKLPPELRFGFLAEDPTFPVHPPVKAALTEAADRIKAAGHEIVALTAEECRIAYSNELIWGFFSLLATVSNVDAIVEKGGEPPIKSRETIMKQIIALGIKFLPEVMQLEGLEKLSLLNIKRAELIESWSRIWKNHRLDAIICPSAQNTAVEHDQFGIVPYTSFLNLLDYPACVLPFQKVQATRASFQTQEGQSAPAYNEEVLEGAPCSIQVFTTPMRDEECVAIAKIVDDCLRGKRAKGLSVL